jgi:hypothetical protein
MLHSRKLARFLLRAALILLCAASAFTQTDNTVVAEVNGQKLTVADLEQEESSKLLQAHNQYYQAEKRLSRILSKGASSNRKPSTKA